MATTPIKDSGKNPVKSSRVKSAAIPSEGLSKDKSVAPKKPLSLKEKVTAQKAAVFTALNTKTILSDQEYVASMLHIEELMNIGGLFVSPDQLQEIRRLSVLVQDYEQDKYPLGLPESLIGIIEMKMFEMKLSLKRMAKLLHMSEAKLSLVLSGKQKPEAELLKWVHTELKVDAHFLLSLI